MIEPRARPCYQGIVRRSPLRSVLALAVLAPAMLAGCPGVGGRSPTGGGECFVDQECISGEICARDELCWPADEVRLVKATWTVRGMPASEATCAQHPDLHIRFDGNVSDDLGFSPVPCATGMFVVDKLPLPFTRVELTIGKNGPGNTASINSAGMAALDLPF